MDKNENLRTPPLGTSCSSDSDASLDSATFWLLVLLLQHLGFKTLHWGSGWFQEQLRYRNGWKIPFVLGVVKIWGMQREFAIETLS